MMSGVDDTAADFATPTTGMGSASSGVDSESVDGTEACNRSSEALAYPERPGKPGGLTVA